ncbi:pyridoxamine 5'-phosphate oxidase family protein [Streptomyces atratus]
MRNREARTPEPQLASPPWTSPLTRASSRATARTHPRPPVATARRRPRWFAFPCGLGRTRDVSMIEGVEVLEIDALPQERGDRFVAHTGFDPRALATPYRWFRITPLRIQAWREVNEPPDRELMRDGRWLV